ncbi:glutamate racemase [Compostibacter hankyongensis]|uniref:Glutamate racemase n=1 Tax=Compostibacter hankyongensis TaxID=1007089 RepID=A0ABP8FKL2_9BACT
MTAGPIGVFDSGYGGLTVLKSFIRHLPEYDYLYLGDNARAPYGTRSFDTVHRFTLECVKYLFEQGCHLVILACNTASAKALRTIQQRDLPLLDPSRRVLGVIRPTAEIAGNLTRSRQIGVLATAGTVASGSYPIEVGKFFPDIQVFQEACPMWVPLVENGEAESDGADYFIRKKLDDLLGSAPGIDALLLGCTHYPLLLPKIKQYLPEGVEAYAQGDIVAASLADYLERHPEMAARCSRGGTRTFCTTDDPVMFDRQAEIFFGAATRSVHVDL